MVGECSKGRGMEEIEIVKGFIWRGVEKIVVRKRKSREDNTKSIFQ